MKRILTSWVAAIVYVAVFIVVVVVIGNLVEIYTNSPTSSSTSSPSSSPNQMTKEAYNNTARNTFISGCTEAGRSNVSGCTCAWDSLVTLYGEDWWGNGSGYSPIIDRILASGYNSTETDAMSPCFEPATTNIN